MFYGTRRGPFIGRQDEFILRMLPYLTWQHGGYEVLADRNYVPLFKRRPGETPIAADPSTPFCKVTAKQIYSDSMPAAEQRKRAEELLHKWGAGIHAAVMTQIERRIEGAKPSRRRRVA